MTLPKSCIHIALGKHCLAPLLTQGISPGTQHWTGSSCKPRESSSRLQRKRNFSQNTQSFQILATVSYGPFEESSPSVNFSGERVAAAYTSSEVTQPATQRQGYSFLALSEHLPHSWSDRQLTPWAPVFLATSCSHPFWPSMKPRVL